jgi:hypothetical protein
LGLRIARQEVDDISLAIKLAKDSLRTNLRLESGLLGNITVVTIANTKQVRCYKK